LTAPSEHNPLSYTEKRIWIEKHLGFDFVERLIICSNKSLLKGDILIDDHISGKGQENFEGQLIHFGSEEFLNWVMVQKTLE
jgi:5'(3')-deoxyribonucleotidase